MRAPTPRTIGEAALESPSPLRAGEAPGVIAGAAGASTAAAAASAAFVLPREAAAPASGPAPVRAATQPAPEVRDVLDLIWFDPDSVPRIRRQTSWKKILDDLGRKPLDKDLDDPATAKDPMDLEDRREVFEILAHASATDAMGIEEALGSAVRDDGKFVAPLRLIAADLIFPFDEIEALKSLVATATPFLANDENLRAAVTNAQDFLKIPDLRSSPVVSEGLAARIREAWSQGRRPVPQTYLEEQTERALLEGRCYQRRKVLGGKHLRALAQPLGAQSLVPAYLPDALADQLPLDTRFRARFVAAVHQRADRYEAHPAALHVLALARALPPPARR
jgi:hypothetical protein